VIIGIQKIIKAIKESKRKIIVNRWPWPENF